MKFASTAVLAASVASAQGAQWAATSVGKYTSLMGVAATSATQAFCSVMDNAVGTGVLVTNDAGASSDFYGPAGAMNMAIAVSGDGNTVAMVGIGGIFLGAPESADMTKVTGIRTITQSVEAIGQSGFAATGQFTVGKTNYNGVAITLDGTTWTESDINVDYNLYPARYGAFPSSDTWFVSAGTWPMSSQTAVIGGATQLTARLTVDASIKGGEISYVQQKSPKSLRGQVSSSADPTGYTGAIAKTTDGGKTWSTVYETDQLYFNQIHCASENACVAVGENDSSAFAVATQDGGASWNTVFTGPAGLSLAAARMITETEYWIGGGPRSCWRNPRIWLPHH